MTTVTELGSEAALVRRVRARARRRVRWLRSAWSPGPPGERWLALTHTEADAILDGRWSATADWRRPHPDDEANDAEIAAADAAVEADPAWLRLRWACELSDPEADLLSLAVAAEADPTLTRLYGYLQDEPGPALPSPALAAVLFDRRPLAMGAGAGLRRWSLARPADDAASVPASAAGWVADPAVARWLVGADPAIDELGPAVTVAPVRPAPAHPDELAAALSFLAAIRAADRRRGADRPTPVELAVVGPDGAGRTTFAAAVATATGAGLIAVDLPRLLAAPRHGWDPLARVLRLARLTDAVVHWRDPDSAPPGSAADLHAALPLTTFGCTGEAGAPVAGVAQHVVRLGGLSRPARLAMWRRASELPAPRAVVDRDLLPAELLAGAVVAPAGERASTAAAQPGLAGIGDLVTPLATPWDWDDIVLAEPVRAHLADLRDMVDLRGDVHHDWGFGRLAPGGGVTAMFAGPSGTGKTMAAQVLARAWGRDLLRVDLAGVVDKYVGETEKRLRRLFDVAERSSAVLLFDEADALFGRRTQVRDAHDRFANIEINYLLQRMERFRGVALLATNRRNDVDPAFLRRLTFIVEFLQPGPPERLRLWRACLGGPAPDRAVPVDGIGDDELVRFAEELELSGAEIASAALGAAFLARAERSLITPGHVLRAVRREYAKRGGGPLPSGWTG